MADVCADDEDADTIMGDDDVVTGDCTVDTVTVVVDDVDDDDDDDDDDVCVSLKISLISFPGMAICGFEARAAVSRKALHSASYTTALPRCATMCK